MKVSAKTTKNPNSVTVEVNIPEKLSALVQAYGEEVVTNAARGAIVISLQSYMRRMIDKGTNAADMQKACAAWKPDTRAPAATPFQKVAGSISKLSPEERKALLAELTKAH